MIKAYTDSRMSDRPCMVLLFGENVTVIAPRRLVKLIGVTIISCRRRPYHPGFGLGARTRYSLDFGLTGTAHFDGVLQVTFRPSRNRFSFHTNSHTNRGPLLATSKSKWLMIVIEWTDHEQSHRTVILRGHQRSLGTFSRAQRTNNTEPRALRRQTHALLARRAGHRARCASSSIAKIRPAVQLLKPHRFGRGCRTSLNEL